MINEMTSYTSGKDSWEVLGYVWPPRLSVWVLRGVGLNKVSIALNKGTDFDHFGLK